MSQIKKKFFTFFLLLGIFIILNTSKIMAQETISENQSDVVDQKSIIEEQQVIIEEKSPYAETIQTLTEEEKELICRITYREAGNQPIKGQRAVMEVILNRLHSESWPNDIKTILSTPGQFSTWEARHKVNKEQLQQMQGVLHLVELHTNTVLPSEDYVYFNCKNPNKESVQIEGHWFWV